MIIVKEVKEANAITHGGVFHADDVMATAMLSKVEPNLALARVPSQEMIPEDFDGIVYDIGGGKFDHHQKGGNGCRNNGIPYASAGLIWRYYGEEILKKAGIVDVKDGLENIDSNLIALIDARDNGIRTMTGELQDYSLSEMVDDLNPTWNEVTDSNNAFCHAVEFASMILNRLIIKEKSRQEAFRYLQEALGNAENGIVYLPRYLPWKNYYGKEFLMEDVYYVVFPSLRGGYNIQCVPPLENPFGQKKPIPQEWRSLSKSEYESLGLHGISFVHNAGFIAVANSKKSAMEFAEKLMKTQ